jgi:hypothetical protein
LALIFIVAWSGELMGASTNAVISNSSVALPPQP